nr:O-antigen acetylase [uncultured bacterium]
MNNLKRIPQLDALRGIAILLVIAWHYLANAEGVSPGSALAYAQALFRLTWSGVDLFFVLSGFLIGGILLENRTAKNYFRVFYVRRFCRILPLYAVVLVAFYLLPLGTWLKDGAAPWWVYVTFTQNFWMAQTGNFTPNFLNVTWSLAIEEQFYLTLPLIIRLTPPKWLPRVALACAIAAPLLRTAVYFLQPYGAVAAYVLMPCRMDALMLGVFGAWFVRNREGGDRLLYIVLGVTFLGVPPLVVANQGIGSLLMSTIGYSWLSLMYFSLVIVAVRSACRVFRLRLLAYTGVLAYGLYLFHQPIRGLLQAGPARLNYVLPFALAAVYVLAHLSWYNFEKFLIKRSHRFVYKP